MERGVKSSLIFSIQELRAALTMFPILANGIYIVPMWSAAALVETHAVSKNQEVNEDVNSFLSHLNLSTSFDQMDLHNSLIIQITPKVAILATPNQCFFGSKYKWICGRWESWSKFVKQRFAKEILQKMAIHLYPIQ